MTRKINGNIRKIMAWVMSLILVLCNNVIALAADDSCGMAESMEILSVEETYGSDSGVSLYGGTYYFIPDNTFTLTTSATSAGFNVPTGCNLRYMVGVVASDKQVDYIYVSLISASTGKTVKTITVPTNEAQVFQLGYVPSGIYYLRYTSSRLTVTYTVMNQLYTWDY